MSDENAPSFEVMGWSKSICDNHTPADALIIHRTSSSLLAVVLTNRK
jgi:hypothetical protein